MGQRDFATSQRCGDRRLQIGVRTDSCELGALDHTRSGTQVLNARRDYATSIATQRMKRFLRRSSFRDRNSLYGIWNSVCWRWLDTKAHIGTESERWNHSRLSKCRGESKRKSLGTGLGSRYTLSLFASFLGGRMTSTVHANSKRFFACFP